MKTIIRLTAAIVLTSGCLNAAVLGIYNAGTTGTAPNPTTAGFAATLSAIGPNLTVQGLSPDGSTGYNAWEINHSNPTPSTYGLYQTALTGAAAVPAGTGLDIQLRVNVKSSGSSVSSVNGGITAYWDFDGMSGSIEFALDASNNPTFGLPPGQFAAWNATSVGSGGSLFGTYVLYDLKSTNVAPTVFEVYANGVDTGVSYAESTSSALNRFGFGSYEGSGDAAWNLVSISTAAVPEPFTSGLLAFGVGMILWRCGGRKRD